MKKVKIVVVGSDNIPEGKSEIIRCIANPEDLEDQENIIRSFTKQMTFGKKEYEIELIYTSNDEASDDYRALCYPDSDLIIFAFSLVIPDSLEIIATKFAPEIRKCYPLLPYVLVGTGSIKRDQLLSGSEEEDQNEWEPIQTNDAMNIKGIINAEDYLEINCDDPESVLGVLRSSIQILAKKQTIIQNKIIVHNGLICQEKDGKGEVIGIDNTQNQLGEDIPKKFFNSKKLKYFRIYSLGSKDISITNQQFTWPFARIRFPSRSKIEYIGWIYFMNLRILPIPFRLVDIHKMAFQYALKLDKFQIKNLEGLHVYKNDFFEIKNDMVVRKNEIVVVSRGYNSPLSIPIEITEMRPYSAAYIRNQIELIFEKPSSVIKLGEGSFTSSLISSVEIPSSCKEIGVLCFHRCLLLKSITFESNSQLRKIQDFAFSFIPLTYIILPSSVRSLGAGCFKDCVKLRTVSFQEGSLLEEFPNNCFQNAIRLRKLTIPPRVKDLNENFVSNLAEQINIDLSQTDNFVFDDCVMYDKYRKKLIFRISEPSSKSLIIPNSVEEIVPSSLKHSFELNEIIIDDENMMNAIDLTILPYYVEKVILSRNIKLINGKHPNIKEIVIKNVQETMIKSIDQKIKIVALNDSVINFDTDEHNEVIRVESI